MFRITSYNVCYTKLLRASIRGTELKKEEVVALQQFITDAQLAENKKFKGVQIVITSYSIHYTKLYEIVIQPTKELNANSEKMNNLRTVVVELRNKWIKD